MQFRRSDFPEGFLFGAATAAYQIEGHKFGGAGSTHWDTFAATPGNVIRAEDGALACDHYHRFGEDLDLLQEAGMDAYRFSTSWARVMPDGKTPNPKGLDFYDMLTDAILERGLKPFQTLYHWELPSALADQGGWTNRDTVHRFGEFVDVITNKIGDRMDSIATVNEPWCVAFLSHFLGHHAPGLRDIRATARAMHHINLAHGEAMTRLRDKGMKNCGIVLNFDHATPLDDTQESAAAANLQDAISNRWFVEAITKGTYPTEVLAGFAPHMPDGWQDDMEQISQPIDFLGVNYYTRHRITLTQTHHGLVCGTFPEICPSRKWIGKFTPKAYMIFSLGFRANTSATCRSMSPKMGWRGMIKLKTAQSLIPNEPNSYPTTSWPPNAPLLTGPTSKVFSIGHFWTTMNGHLGMKNGSA